MAVATVPSLHPHRLNLKKSRLLTQAAKGFLGKPLTKAPEPAPGSQSLDYVPLVSAPDPSRSTLPPLAKGRKPRPSHPRSQQGRGVCTSLPPGV